MFKYRNLVRNQTRISDTEPKSDSEIPVWTPDSVHHKHKRHSSLNDVPHNHSATLPPLCMSEDTGTMTETSPRGHLSRIWRPTGNLVCPWEAGSHQQRLWPSVSRPDQSQSHLPAAAVQCCWTRPHRINQHQCGVCDEFTCVNDSWIALITLWWFSCVTLHRLSALLAAPSAVARACWYQTRSIALTNINRSVSWVTASLKMRLTS